MAILYKKFELGNLVSSQGVTNLLRENWNHLQALSDLFTRHQAGDWVFVTEDESYSNEISLKNDEAIKSKYLLGGKEIIILTLGDRSETIAALQKE